ncbi:YidC/Oxa1 family insertase periplasmic-domain containing protein, partial [Vicingaceae bacterium]|nr:YidC/Oxa1 family insertase periplasmic-domain containing protein [Vicingaceae bacterium]
MDKNTLVGLLLIGAIVIGFGILNGPSEEEIAEGKRISDSIAQLEAVQQEVIEEQAQKMESSFNEVVDTSGEMTIVSVSDSAVLQQQAQSFGVFAQASVGEAKEFEVETDLMRLTFSTKGGGIKKAVLKKYFRYAEDGEQGEELILFDSTSNFNLNFFTRDSKDITTDELLFTTESTDFMVNGDNEKMISFKLNAGSDRYIEYIYKINGNDYMIDFDVNLVEMDQVMDMRTGEVYINWMVNAPNQEKSLKPQRDATTIFYKYKNEDVDDLGISDEREELETSMKWVSLKQ